MPFHWEANSLNDEMALFHRTKRRRNLWTECHARDNVHFQIDTIGDLDQFNPVRGQLKDRAFGHIDDGAMMLAGKISREADLGDAIHQFLDLAMLSYRKATVSDVDDRGFGFEAAAKLEFLSILSDVNEAAGTDNIRTEAGDVDMAFTVKLGHAEASDIETVAMEAITRHKPVGAGSTTASWSSPARERCALRLLVLNRSGADRDRAGRYRSRHLAR